jgi:hypothetical protein
MSSLEHPLAIFQQPNKHRPTEDRCCDQCKRRHLGQPLHSAATPLRHTYLDRWWQSSHDCNSRNTRRSISIRLFGDFCITPQHVAWRVIILQSLDDPGQQYGIKRTAKNSTRAARIRHSAHPDPRMSPKEEVKRLTPSAPLPRGRSCRQPYPDFKREIHRRANKRSSACAAVDPVDPRTTLVRLFSQRPSNTIANLARPTITLVVVLINSYIRGILTTFSGRLLSLPPSVTRHCDALWFVCAASSSGRAPPRTPLPSPAR